MGHQLRGFEREHGDSTASEMVLATERVARVRWREARLYFYVTAWEISTFNRGYCFQVAGRHQYRTIPIGLVDLETTQALSVVGNATAPGDDFPNRRFMIPMPGLRQRR